MLRTMSGLASGADAVQVIGSIAVPLVALAAIVATVWTTSRTMEDNR